MKQWFIFSAIAVISFGCQSERQTTTAQNEEMMETNTPDDYKPSSVSPRSESRYAEDFSGIQGFSGTNSEERFETTEDVETDEAQPQKRIILRPEEELLGTDIDRESVTNPEAEVGKGEHTDYD